MRERQKSQPAIEIDGRATITSSPSPPFTPIVDHRDEACPERLDGPEREVIFQQLQILDERSWTHERRLDELEKTRSMPITLTGPRGFSVTGNWRIVVLIAVLSAVVTLTYLTLRYRSPASFYSTPTQPKAAL